MHTNVVIDVGHIDFRPHGLLRKTHGPTAAAVETLVVHAAEILDTRNGEIDEPIQETPHAVAPDGDHECAGRTFTHFEIGHGLLGLDHDGLLTCDLAIGVDHGVAQFRLELLILKSLAHAGGDNDLGELWNLVLVLELELLHHLWNHFFLEDLM